MAATIQRLMTAAARETLDIAAAERLYSAAENAPRKDYVRIEGIAAYCKRDRHSKDHHTLTICLEGED